VPLGNCWNVVRDVETPVRYHNLRAGYRRMLQNASPSARVQTEVNVKFTYTTNESSGSWPNFLHTFSRDEPGSLTAAITLVS
jgi:hypothetical protein